MLFRKNFHYWQHRLYLRADIPEQQIIMTDQHSGAVLDIITYLVSYYSRLHLCLHTSST